MNRIYFILIGQLTILQAFSQPQKEIFIPIQQRSELKLEPDLDTLEEGTEYIFRYEIAEGFKISQSFFDKGLATLYDSFIVIQPKPTFPKGTEKSSLRFIIINQQKTRILLMKEYILKSTGKFYPVLPKSKTNIIKLYPDFRLERNNVYNKRDLLERPRVLLFDNEYSDTARRIKAVRLTIIKGNMEKHFRSPNDSLSLEMLREIRRIKGKHTAFLCLEVPHLRNKIRNVWMRFFITD
ncbi:MAG: hypothetical protein RMJ53_00500 [Chitinophagales bacterium]|nr:hypothetical protein [Chitinophagales bacterium]